MKMKGYFIFLVCCVFLPARGQQITFGEYFLDADPGFGNGTPLNFVPGSDLDFQFNVDLQAVPSGIHTLYVRLQDDSSRRSLSSAATFLKTEIGGGAPAFSKLEYFLDTDPGRGNGIAVPITADDSLDLVFNIDLSTISSGVHQLYLRAQDNFGRWSLLQSFSFLKVNSDEGTASLTRLEYFIDSDPGFGNGTEIPLSGTDSIDLTVNIDLSAVNDGIHYLYLRGRDDTGRWSLMQRSAFLKEAGAGLPADLQRLEYFFDDDPGFGNGIPISNNAAPSADLLVNLDLNDLADGEHDLYVRGQDSRGRWRLLNRKRFSVGKKLLPEIVLTDQVSGGIKQYYLFDVPPELEGQSVLITVEADDEEAVLEWYMSTEALPTRGGSERSYVFRADNDEKGFYLSELQTGIYYFLLYSDNPMAVNVDILVQVLGFELQEFSPSSGGRSGPITVELLGGQFSPEMEVSLEQGGNQILPSQSLSVVNPSRAFATFDLTAIPEDIYDLKIEQEGFDPILVTDTFTVVRGDIIPGYNTNPVADGCSPGLVEDGAILFVDVENPRNVRLNSLIIITINFENRSSIDIPAPTRVFLSDTGIPMSLSADNVKTEGTSELLLTLREPDGPEDILRAGARGSITVYAFVNQRGPNEFQLLR